VRSLQKNTVVYPVKSKFHGFLYGAHQGTLCGLVCTTGLAPVVPSLHAEFVCLGASGPSAAL
jgi:hypothetical protein